MATKVQVVTEKSELQGFSGVEKPQAGNGTTFHEIDTGRVYIAHENDWFPDLRMARAIRDSAFIK
jgi:hypothetical protein